MSVRPHKREYFMEIADVVASRSTCVRRAVGCVLINDLDQIIATGYNGRHRGAPNCNGHSTSRCAGADSPTGSNLEGCEAIHAEQNALMQCANVHEIAVCFVTTAPCVHCVKMLLNTSCRIIVYGEEYAASGLKLWTGALSVDADGKAVRQRAFQVTRAGTVREFDPAPFGPGLPAIVA